MVRRAAIVAMALIVISCEGPDPTQANEFGPEEAVADFIEQGIDAHIVVSPYARSVFLTGASTEYLLCLDTQESTLYEYSSESLREADSSTIRLNGQPEDGVIDLEYGRLMWWAKGRVIVNYSFADPRYWDTLTTVLGETISPAGESFSDPPDPLPPSEVCG